jgi:hypothetical protein
MPLRLFVTQSTSHDTHGSLREFARGLAYFGKPDRHRLIQDLYTRSSQAGQGSPAATPVPPPIPASEPANEATRRKQPKREPIKKWLFAAALLGVVAGSGAWLWNRGGSTGDMQDGAVRMLSGAADALADLGQQVSQALGSEVPAPVAASADSTDDRSRPKPKRRPTADAVGAEPAPIVSRRVSLPKAAGASSLAAAMPPRVDFEATAVYARARTGGYVFECRSRRRATGTGVSAIDATACSSRHLRSGDESHGRCGVAGRDRGTRAAGRRARSHGRHDAVERCKNVEIYTGLQGWRASALSRRHQLGGAAMTRAMCGALQNEFRVVPDFRTGISAFYSSCAGAWFLQQCGTRRRHMVWSRLMNRFRSAQ